MLVPFIGGILVQYFLNPGFWTATAGLALSAAVLVKANKLQKGKHKYRYLYGVSAFMSFMFLGICVANIRHKTLPDISDFQDNAKKIAIVSQPLEEKPKSWKCQLTLLDNTMTERFEIVSYFAKDSTKLLPEMGDLIVFNSNLQRIKNSGNPLEFDYEGYMAKQGIYYSAYIKSDDYSILHNGYQKGIKYYSCKIRSYLINIYRKFDFSEKELGVLEALTLGYKNDLDEDTKSAFQSSGAMHVLAVSGLHTGIIMMITSALLCFLNKSRRQRIIKCLIICSVIWMFAAITGFSSSVNRAALMFSLMAIGDATGRNTTTYNTLALSCFILLMINPYLIFNVGFGLSYLAVLSIVALMPLFEKIEISTSNKVLKYVIGIVFVSIAAQVGTSVLSICTFGQFPVFFLLTNILVIPLAYIIMIVAIILLVVSGMNFIANGVFYVLKYAVKCMTGCVSFIEDIPGSCIKNIYLDNWSAILIYCIFASLIIFAYYDRFAWIKAAVVSLALITTLYYYNIIRYKCHEVFAVYNISKTSAVQINNKLIINNLDNKEKTITTASPLLGYYGFDRMEILNSDSLKYSEKFFNVEGKVVGLINNRQLLEALQDNFKTDVLILSNNADCTVEELKQRFNPEIIVFDSSNSFKYRQKQKASGTTVHIHDVAENGAFVLGEIKY
ncbi:MAG: ComEC family competence protein [Bacteroidales bacterium]|nr:ComEC family competence protein [Bacteroidales bacterium]